MNRNARSFRFTTVIGLSTCFCAASVQADTWGPGVNLRPKFKLEAVGFHCNDETGYDSPWFDPWISDEVRVGISTPAATWASPVFQDVDSGESRSFSPDQSCILPLNGQGIQYGTWT